MDNIERERLNFTTKLAYGSGDMGPAITANILIFFLLYFFTNVAGLPAGLSGSILAIGKVGDAINDPIVGIMSDRTRNRWGRRIPWMLFGAIPFGILYFLQWIVPRFSSNLSVNNWCLFVYYVIIGILFNIAYTVVNLPYTALTPDLTQDYNERTNLNSFRFAFSIGGSILSLVLATFIFQAYPDDPRQQYIALGIVTSLLSTIAIFWCSFRIQERGTSPVLNQQAKKVLGFILAAVGTIGVVYGIAQFSSNKSNASLYGVSGILLGIEFIAFGLTLIFAKTEAHLNNSQAIAARNEANNLPITPIKEQLKIAFANKAFLYVIGIYLCSWLAVQLTASILIYFVVSWMGMKESDFPLVAIAVQGTSLLMLFFWQYVSEKLGKKAVYYLGMIIWIMAQAALFLIKPGQITLLYIAAIMAGVGVSVAYLIPWSMIPDVVDSDELETGERREGIFYSFMVLLQKFGLAIALLVVGQALEFSGFIQEIPGKPIPIQPDSALLAIRIAIAPLPTVFLIIGLVLTYFYPITKQVHANIRIRLQARKINQDNQ
ncbi:sugar (glycoside-pentoside-hexuronide) transporter [Chondrocystis sp. NIES-4102]|nr:sugar (glycoside-pentoside-hexuronide) transporter [Chondrocystis sp. NIES-4102]